MGPLLVMGAGLLVLVGGALLYVARSPRLALERAVEPPRVEKGQPAIAVIRAVNLSWRTLSSLVIEQRLGDVTFRAELPRLRRGEAGLRTYRLPTSRRGTYSVGPVEIPKADPFGLCRRVRALGEPQVISVHPRALRLSALPSGMSRNLEGPSSDMSPQGSVTFHRLREYVIGDDLRTVHWLSTARTGKLVVRHNVDTSQPYTVVLVDIRPEVYSSETFEEAMDVTASVATSLSAGKAPVQIRTTAGERVGGAGQRDPAGLVDYLTESRSKQRRLVVGTNHAPPARSRRERACCGDRCARARHPPIDSVPQASLRPRHRGLGRPATAPAPVYPGVRVLVVSTADELAQAWGELVTR